MPTSTLWRGDVVNTTFRGTSPTRPIDYVERLSPEPLLPPSYSTAAHNTYSSYDQDLLQGLGLSRSGLEEDAHPAQREEHIYTDHSGVAHSSNSYLDNSYSSPPKARTSRQGRRNPNSRSSKANGHTRSGSTIDDLADAAIATSPTFANGSPSRNAFVFSGSPTSHTTARPSTSHITRYAFYDGLPDHPTKRVKSEIIHQYEFNHDYPRPTTSYHQPAYRIPDEDVALLLGLKQEIKFKSQRSPPSPIAELHYSPHSHRAYSPVPVAPLEPKIEEQYIHSHEEDVLPYTNGVVADTIVEEREEPQNDKTAEDLCSTNLDGISTSSLVVHEPAPDEQTIPESLPALPAAAVTDETPPVEVKKTRRVKPQIQAEVCTECNKLQSPADEDDVTISWICCNACNKWFHSACAGFKSKSEARSVDKFVCKPCEPEHGSTTFVRKSSRARTAIDYAELNQGLVKSSIETSMHHYIEPIKNGKFTIQPDDFMRVRPEVLTVEFMQNFNNMKRPFVVPAAWNPRFGARRPAEASSEGDVPAPLQCFDSNGNSLPAVSSEPEPDQNEEVIDCEQDLLDMVMPRDLTVRMVAELYGKHELVPVIDVKTQETKGSFTLEQWADYYEDSGDKPVRNVISLEVSESPLGRIIRRPKVVRDLDLEEMVWDAEARSNQKKRPVQFYCLMSVADSYTDFHIDFGGSSVYYHILKGTKTFFFIPPEDRYLKKYEEWCNSQTQNDTWLPDLCNGNVTRVDLHEGDTALIPAGWIHSVWTPEDSLVIGGNFLTPIDYELQLKVAQVEKATKVAAKFRYPFFQKVMWYALIKYLEDDPVPDEIMDDFQEDPEHVFLRANPLWLELGDLQNQEEPGSSMFNARYYPKAEIKGFPALRDYLYRTARIYADLPVDNINKKQIDAVKASVPKGHGDPLVLIKTFAVWCAWKTGGTTVPAWVYSDAGGFPEVEQKARKPETYRLPGERTSQRKAAQAAPKETTGPAVITLYKPGFTAAGVNPDPAKKGRPPGTKPVLGRVACDACRRRRVKCKHRNGEGGVAGSEQPLSRSQTPDVTVPSLSDEFIPTITPVKAPSLPALTSTDSEPFFMTSGLAQAALATLDGQANGAMIHTADSAPSSGKKSRSKACEECRKSKRRCVHDEYGRIDPAKAAEPSKPRGSSNAKRPARPSDEGLQMKRLKVDETQNGNIDAMIDPALFTTDVTQDVSTEPQHDFQNGNFEVSIFQPHMPVLPGSGLYPGLVTTDLLNIDPALENSSVVPNGVDPSRIKAEPDGDVPMTGVEPHIDSILPNHDTHEHAIMDSPGVNTYMMGVTPVKSKSGSPTLPRQSSQQPKQVELFMPEDSRSPSKTMPKPTRSASMASSRPSPASVRSGRSSSNTSGTIHHQMNGLITKRDEIRQRSLSTASSALDEDEKLARVLQAQEHGLRRRRSSVVR